MVVSSDSAVWVGVILSTLLFTHLIKDQPLYRIAESIFAAASVGHLGATAILSLNRSVILPILKGEFILILVLLMGILLFSRLTVKYAWYSLYPTAILAGVGIGITLGTTIELDLINQIIPMIESLAVNNLSLFINNLVATVGTLCVLIYFIFTLPVKRNSIRTIRKIGRLFLMATFGAILGNGLLSQYNPLLKYLTTLLYTLLGLGR